MDDFLRSATGRLTDAGIGTARLDTLILLEDALQKDRAWLLAHPETVLEHEALELLEAQIKRRAKHQPLAYIRGKTEFYGREFCINKHVLEPRPESETMIDLLKRAWNMERGTWHKQMCIVDVGTGSGCLAITAQLELPDAAVIATDIDPDCLKVACQNAKTLGAKVTILEGDLLRPLSTLYPIPYTLVLANLPYVPDDFTLNQAALNEPRRAIFGGPDGLDLYRRLFDEVKGLKVPPRYVLTESLPFQHQALRDIAAAASYKQQAASDFIQLFTLYPSP